MRRRRPGVVVVGVVALVAVFVLPSSVGASGDPLRGEQWGHDLIGVDAAWSAGRGRGAVVAIIDTGVALDHPDLVDRFVRDADGEVVGLDLIDPDTPPGDTHGHGTLVAGIVAATAANDEGIAGVAPETRLLPIRVLDAEGAGNADDVDRAIRWAVDRGADVINVSLEAAREQVAAGDGPAVPAGAVQYATERGVAVVVAAGNRVGASAGYADDSSAVVVGAVGRDGRPAAFSDGDRPEVLLAPGVEIVSTWCQRTATGCDPAASPYGVATGTSFAAPHVSGVAALLAAQGHAAADIIERLWSTAVPAAADRYRVDAAAGLGVAGGAAAAASADTAAVAPELPVAQSQPGAPAPRDEPGLPSETQVEEPAGQERDASSDAAVPAPTDGDADRRPEPGDRDGSLLAAPSAGTDGGLLLRIVAAGLLLVTMATWSAAARAADRAASAAAAH